MTLYPLKFQPILKEKIWGGEKLKDVLNKASQSSSIGESWEISAVTDFESVVSNGKLKDKTLSAVINQFGSDLLGQSVLEKFDGEFPLLIKYIDASKKLSVQVHPNDEMAKRVHNSSGKTELWYIMDADERAEIYLGFTEILRKKQFVDLVHNQNLKPYLQRKKVKNGDVYFLPAGKMHSIGGGILLAEIQQTSDLTYRIYDWDRVDDTGNSRELHIGLATEAIDFENNSAESEAYEKIQNQSNPIVDNQYFTTNFLPVHGELAKDFTNLDSFIIYLCVDGEMELEGIGFNKEIIKKGETILIPAAINQLNLSSKNGANLLEVWIEV